MKQFSEMAKKLRGADELRKLNSQIQCSTCKASTSGDLPKYKIANATTMGPDEMELHANIKVCNVFPTNAENSESQTFFYDIQPLYIYIC